MIKHFFFIVKGYNIFCSPIFGNSANTKTAGIVPFNIRIQSNLCYFIPLFKYSFKERNCVLCNIIAIIAKSIVPCIYYAFSKYLPINYMVSSSFAVTLFYQNTTRELFIIKFSLVPGRKEMTYSKVVTKEK